MGNRRLNISAILIVRLKLLLFGAMVSIILTIPRVSHSAEKPAVPKYLFHWMSKQSMEWVAESLPSGIEDLPLSSISERQAVAVSWKTLVGKRALFTWSHPTAALRFSEDEVYARTGDNGEPPVLLFLKPDPNSKVLVLDENSRSAPGVWASLDLYSYDLIFHRGYGQDGDAFQEWIVINPKTILAFSAAPSFLPKEVKEEMSRSIEPGFEFRPEEQYTEKIEANDPEFRREVIVNYFSLRDGDIPEFYRRPFPKDALGQIDSSNCNELLGAVSAAAIPIAILSREVQHPSSRRRSGSH